MPVISPAFVPDDPTYIYQVWVYGYPDPFDAPVSSDDDIFRNVVHPCRNDDPYRMEMWPASGDDCHDLEDLHDPAVILESHAMRVTSAITFSSFSKEVYAIILMCWHLVDHHADVTEITEELDFTDIDVAIWATLAVYRQARGLRQLLQKDALYMYLSCFCQLVAVLALYHVTVHTENIPVESSGDA
jgi:hypothetical protein